VAEASDISFGVYLAHPLVLQLLLSAGLGNAGQRMPAPLATVVAFVGATVGAVAITLVARRTRLSLALTGRPRRLPTAVRSQLPGVSEDRLPVLSAARATMTS
jgi:peptidoglycan/LPS O-acetylase OafA/YrhL